MTKKILCLLFVAMLLVQVIDSRKSKWKCTQPRKVGDCRAKLKRWYYNKKSGKCEIFWYGGCKGNGNNFKRLAACERKCIRKKGRKR